ncbi:MAG: hypothetical protein L6Q76_06825, partial [Polyangiaceae bacterium]|nr:hypothetical protein [Polyangiaceae bacterium]
PSHSRMLRNVICDEHRDRTILSRFQDLRPEDVGRCILFAPRRLGASLRLKFDGMFLQND